MPNIYWFQSGADAHWETVTGNWWDDAAHTQQASAVPQANDYVYMLGTTAPDTAPTITLSGLDSSGMNPGTAWLAVNTLGITIAEGGTLIFGYVGSEVEHQWTGTVAGATASCIFQGVALNDSGGGGGGTVGDDAIFNNSTGSISLEADAVGDGATFNDNATSTTAVGDGATYNDEAGVEDGTVGDHATFNDASYMLDGVVGDYAVLNNTFGNFGGTIGDYARINCRFQVGGDIGTYSGGNYFIGGGVVFAPEAVFSGSPTFHRTGCPIMTGVDGLGDRAVLTI